MANKLVFMAFFLILIILMTLQSYSGATKGQKEVNVCAACKHQKHGCPANCIFRRYFPANRPHDFRNFHRLFKVTEIKDWFITLSQGQRDDAAKSIKFQSNMRALFPVGGCLQVISTLRYKIALLTDELNLVRTQIANFNPASNHAAAAVFNPAVTDFNPDAAVFNPNAATYNLAAVYNDNQLQFDDPLLTDDWLRSFFQTKESGDKCRESKKKDDKYPFP